MAILDLRQTASPTKTATTTSATTKASTARRTTTTSTSDDNSSTTFTSASRKASTTPDHSGSVTTSLSSSLTTTIPSTSSTISSSATQSATATPLPNTSSTGLGTGAIAGIAVGAAVAAVAVVGLLFWYIYRHMKSSRQMQARTMNTRLSISMPSNPPSAAGQSLMGGQRASDQSTAPLWSADQAVASRYEPYRSARSPSPDESRQHDEFSHELPDYGARYSDRRQGHHGSPAEQQRLEMDYRSPVRRHVSDSIGSLPIGQPHYRNVSEGHTEPFNLGQQVSSQMNVLSSDPSLKALGNRIPPTGYWNPDATHDRQSRPRPPPK